ncbi:MAG: radical SAM protein [Candidatus Nanoarchaeia archaeon]|nr:radical SAM protein [Candidatus Nanoarchaeia archaeon]
MVNRQYTPILKASSYYLEDVLELRLDERAKNGQISFILLNQPPICDAHCRRCFMPNNRRQLGKNEALTLDESKQILYNARKNGALCLEISGEGEPTLNKNLPELIRYANNLEYLTTLITNGHSLTEEQIKIYNQLNVTLVFSHYSLNKKKYELDNKTPGSFDKKMKNLEIASRIFKESIEHINKFKVYRLAVHTTLQKDNIQDALDLKEYCNNNKIFFSIAPLAQTGCAINNPNMKLEEIVNFFGKEIPLSQVPNLLGDNSIIHSHSSAKELGREVCGTCFYGLNIGYEGALLFDAHSGYEIGNKLGNIKTISFQEIMKKRRKISKLLFENVNNFCPVRDSKWDEFIKKF